MSISEIMCTFQYFKALSTQMPLRPNRTKRSLVGWNNTIPFVANNSNAQNRDDMQQLARMTTHRIQLIEHRDSGQQGHAQEQTGEKFQHTVRDTTGMQFRAQMEHWNTSHQQCKQASCESTRAMENTQGA
jgi:hypothetical protein